MTQPVKTWPAKDPDAVLDYVYRIPLDAGDSVPPGQATLVKLSGAVVIDSQSLAGTPDTTAEGYGQDLTAWLSGGTDGEIATFRVSWVTTATREDDAILLLPIIANEFVALALTGYAKPGGAHLIMKYPAFAAVAPDTLGFWLTDAERYVTNAWSEGDYAAGLMALAAHNMALAGLGTDASTLSGVPAGITRMKSGSLELGFTDAAANARMSGGYDSTRYGQEYQLLLRRNRAGPFVAPTGSVPYDSYVRYPQGEA